MQDAKTRGPDFPPLQPIKRRQSHPCKFTLIDNQRSTILHVSNDCRLLTQMIQRIQLTRILNSPPPLSPLSLSNFAGDQLERSRRRSISDQNPFPNFPAISSNSSSLLSNFPLYFLSEINSLQASNFSRRSCDSHSEDGISTLIL